MSNRFFPADQSYEQIRVGTRCAWVSNAGNLSGSISAINVGKNAAGVMVPWIIVQHDGVGSSMHCATESNLIMMGFAFTNR